MFWAPITVLERGCGVVYLEILKAALFCPLECCYKAKLLVQESAWLSL